MSLRVICTVIFLLTFAQPSWAQAVPTRDPVKARAMSEVSSLASAWNALAAGNYADALRTAGEVLKREPWNHAALIVRIRALTEGEGPLRGLDAYEAWLKDSRVPREEDVYLLEPVAVDVLRLIARDKDPGLRVIALTRLARAGIGGARAELAALNDGGATVDAALTSLGDETAAARIRHAAEGPGNRRGLVPALEQGGSASVPILITLLNDKDESTSSAAASALGRLRAYEAVGSLRKSLAADYPFVRHTAAVALARLNDPAGQAEVARMLAMDVPDIQLMAATAWDGQPGPWVEAVRSLLDNQEGLVRLEAARLIAPIDPAAARRVLQEALSNENPVVRSESAKVVEELIWAGTLTATIADLRGRLRDPEPSVRLPAATALLRLIRGHQEAAK
ncbi:MAG TPA: HEAT repeat domain-containing protein [Gemmatimonadaceae bacterium]|nr:HEAT repeat domain-containing protein [Gemmatimonadaceae bacterium]